MITSKKKVKEKQLPTNLKIRETIAQLPDIQFERTICFSGSKLGCMRARIHCRLQARATNWAAYYEALICGPFWWKFYGKFEVSKIDPRTR
jgi:hypothetical protein